MKYLILVLLLISTVFGQARTGPDTILHLKLYAGNTWTTTGPVLHVFDYSLNGHYGTLKGTAHYTYPGVDFDGDSDYIEIADHADFSPVSSDISVSAWIYMDSYAGSFPIVNKYEDVSGNEWFFSVGASGKLVCIFYDTSDAPAHIGRVYDTVLSTSKWIHVVATYEFNAVSPSGTDVKLYLNGAKVDDTDSSDGDFSDVENLEAPVWIGRTGPSYANGKIDDVIMSNKVLTAIEVKNIYEVTRWRHQI